MLNLAEYRRRDKQLADYLPWACLVAPGVVLNKDGSFQRTLALSRARSRQRDRGRAGRRLGAPQQCAEALRRRLGAVLRGRADRCATAIRPAASPMPRRGWSTRSAAPPSRPKARTTRAATSSPCSICRRPTRRAAPNASSTSAPSRSRSSPMCMPSSPAFVTETDRALDLLTAILPEVRALDDAETLTYLHGTVSTSRTRSPCPRCRPISMRVLCDTPLTGGLEPKLGALHLRTLTVLGFPNVTTPGTARCAQRSGLSPIAG